MIRALDSFENGFDRFMNKKQIKVKEYLTKNLSISAYLSCVKEIHFTSAVKINDEFFFKFIPKDKAEELVNQYFAGTANVNPRELFARLHDLKDLIFNQKISKKIGTEK